MDLSTVGRWWPQLLGGAASELPCQGHNNSIFIDTAQGRFVLRCYADAHARRRLKAEVGLCRRLDDPALSFRVPQPIATAEGGWWAEEGELLATLWPRLGGERPEQQRPSHAEAASRALAETLGALAGLDSGLVTAPPYTQLAVIHPLVPNPFAAFADLPISHDERAHGYRLLAHLAERLPILTRTLPKQLIHGDFCRSNLLLRGERVSGVLDWEFATYDVRALDLATLLATWPHGLWGTGAEWPLLRGLYTPFAAHSPLEAAERSAIPDLMRLRWVASLIYWIGRYRQGLDPLALVLAHMADALRVDSWLDRNRGAFDDLLWS